MEIIAREIGRSSSCVYRPDQIQRMESIAVAALGPEEYMTLLLRGWRRFGRTLFRPRCPVCQSCQSLRVIVDRFRPDRGQRRVCKRNEGLITLRIGPPHVSRAKLDLYHRYHAFQAQAKGWPDRDEETVFSYQGSFVDNPFPTEEWCYYLDGRLVGVGYVDDLPGGLSAIYFFHDPNHRARSLGTWNILSVIAEAARRGLPHVYLGYYIGPCSSMAYKARFVPNQVLGADGHWHDFRV
jgi:arginyl-tRNA--protein-N-Asp/Glu arginylyltransferase